MMVFWSLIMPISDWTYGLNKGRDPSLGRSSSPPKVEHLVRQKTGIMLLLPIFWPILDLQIWWKVSMDHTEREVLSLCPGLRPRFCLFLAGFGPQNKAQYRHGLTCETGPGPLDRPGAHIWARIGLRYAYIWLEDKTQGLICKTSGPRPVSQVSPCLYSAYIWTTKIGLKVSMEYSMRQVLAFRAGPEPTFGLEIG